MMIEQLYQKYYPLTANNSEGYKEYDPTEALKPYIRCFWISENPGKELVVPDTCMDIIVKMNEDKEDIQIVFCGINDMPFHSEGEGNKGYKFYFGIRFYFWSVCYFTDCKLTYARNSFDKLDEYFKGWKVELESIIRRTDLKTKDFKEYESFLLERMTGNQPQELLLHMADMIISARGDIKVNELCDSFPVDKRWLERNFLSYFGISPKKLCLLIKYQYIWQECLKENNFNIWDTVEKYGFYDQAHLLNFFKKYHSKPILSHFSKT